MKIVLVLHSPLVQSVITVVLFSCQRKSCQAVRYVAQNQVRQVKL